MRSGCDPSRQRRGSSTAAKPTVRVNRRRGADAGRQAHLTGVQLRPGLAVLDHGHRPGSLAEACQVDGEVARLARAVDPGDIPVRSRPTGQHEVGAGLALKEPGLVPGDGDLAEEFLRRLLQLPVLGRAAAEVEQAGLEDHRQGHLVGRGGDAGMHVVAEHGPGVMSIGPTAFRVNGRMALCRGARAGKVGSNW